MKHVWRVLLIIALGVPAFAATYNVDCSSSQRQCYIPQTTGLATGDIVQVSNTIGGTLPTFEIIYSTTPSNPTITVQGCSPKGTCDTLGTYTSTSSGNYTPPQTAAYSGYKITVTGVTGATVSIGGTIVARGSPSGVNEFYSVVKTTGSPLTLLGVSGYYWNHSASTYNFQLDAPVAGKQYCFGNYSGDTGAITITSTTSVYIVYKGVNGTVTSGTLVSGGAAGDFVCMEGADTTHYMVTGAGYGTWTNN